MGCVKNQRRILRHPVKRSGQSENVECSLKNCFGPFHLKTFMFAVIVSFCIWIAGPASADDTPVAAGEGIVVTRGDVARLQKYMQAKGFRAKYEQHRKIAIRTALFAHEAKVLGLETKTRITTENGGSVEGPMRLSDAYIARLQREYPVSDLVIESYYFAHPEAFDWGEPIGDAAQQQIRQIILKAKRPAIAAKAFEDLKQKYQVHLVGEGK